MKKAVTDLNIEPTDPEKKKTWKYREDFDLIIENLKLNTGLIFTNGDLGAIKKVLDSEKREAPAKVGSIAPADVTVPAGSTGLDPKQTQFFQALSIQTKIVKAQIEIVNPVQIIKADDKISPGQAALLDKLKIRPFEYKMHIKNVLDNGRCYSPAVLSITEAVLINIFQKSASNITALSLGSGYIIAPAAGHLLASAFKNLAAVTMVTDYSFPAADKLKKMAMSAPAAGGAVAGKAAAAAKVEEKPVEEEVDVDMGGMFGDEY